MKVESKAHKSGDSKTWFYEHFITNWNDTVIADEYYVESFFNNTKIRGYYNWLNFYDSDNKHLLEEFEIEDCIFL